MGLDTNANRCFVCGPGNENGLNVRFRLDGEVCRSEWTPTKTYMGYDGITHGGILFCLLDDVMANWLFLHGKVCITARADVRFKNPLPIGIPTRLESRLARRRGTLAVLEGQVRRQDNDLLIVESTGHFMVQGRVENLT